MPFPIVLSKQCACGKITLTKLDKRPSRIYPYELDPTRKGEPVWRYRSLESHCYRYFWWLSPCDSPFWLFLLYSELFPPKRRNRRLGHCRAQHHRAWHRQLGRQPGWPHNYPYTRIPCVYRRSYAGLPWELSPDSNSLAHIRRRLGPFGNTGRTRCARLPNAGDGSKVRLRRLPAFGLTHSQAFTRHFLGTCTRFDLRINSFAAGQNPANPDIFSMKKGRASRLVSVTLYQ